MNLRHISGFLVSGLLAALTLMAAPAAHAQDAFMDKAIMASPAADQWSVLGQGETHAMVRDPDVRGGWALTVTIAAKGENPWDVQAGIPASRPVKKGDVILLAFWARALAAPEGETAIHAPAMVQLTHAPYTQMASEALNIGRDWKLYYVSGIAPEDLAAGESGANIHLATARQSIALGPVFVLDFGAGYDLTKLPHN